MDNGSDEIKGYDYCRSTLKAIADGYQLMRHSMAQLLWVFWPLLLALAVSGAWVSVELMTGNSLLGASLLASLVLYTVVMVIFASAFYQAWGSYRKNGFIPQLKHATFWPSVLRGLLPTVIVLAWCVFVTAFWAALSYYLASLSRLTLAATVPLAAFIGILLLNEAADYLPEGKSLWSSITRSAKVTVRALGSMLSTCVLLLIIYQLVMFLLSLPEIVSFVIESKAHVSMAFGDGADIPGYFVPVCFVVCVVSGLLQWIVISIVMSILSMVYGAAQARIRAKEERKRLASETPLA